MSATLKGRAVIFSVGAIGLTVASVLRINFTQSVAFQRSSEKADVKDNGGAFVSQIFHGFKKTLSLTVIPADAAASQAGAYTSGDNHCIAPGATAVITDDKGTVIDGNYNVISSRQNRTVDGVATFDVELEQGDEGNDLTVAVA